MGDKAGLEDLFKSYAKFGDHKSTGKTMTSKNFDKWMKEAKVQGKDVKSQDTDIAFNKVLGKKPKGTKTIEFSDLDTVLSEIAKDMAKKKEKEEGEWKKELKSKLEQSKPPQLKGTTSAAKTDVVSRLTDTSKYTGSHKERFDDTGKGKGKSGRVDADKADYVQGYKEKGSYEQKLGSTKK